MNIYADLCLCNVAIVLGSFCLGLDGCCLGLGLGLGGWCLGLGLGGSCLVNNTAT